MEYFEVPQVIPAATSDEHLFDDEFPAGLAHTFFADFQSEEFFEARNEPPTAAVRDPQVVGALLVQPSVLLLKPLALFLKRAFEWHRELPPWAAQRAPPDVET